ncbi:transglycosylase domain-containing protein [Pontibacillus litoralis]|uniref:Penicillin-binding protein 2D n=1 Tax=Pontibacillus litoralis JSM 072002 TaxID=1385512 RepID=A0A0A5G091_9BACI|nr:PBP1A family penicillin-binding protein [Pontibacillus litoralis]KGX86486.1 penicillin-binding protein 2D [Pontibacillus litoralis JSM 072002]
MNNKQLFKWFLRVTGAMTVLFLCGIISILLYCYTLGAPSLKSEQNTLFYDEAEQVIGVEHGEENRYGIAIDEMDPTFVQATLLTEDKRFYQHWGFDFKRIVAAIYHNVRQLTKAQGASTITQQYARNLYLTHEKTWLRKWKEAMYAIRLEMFYDKDTILEGYLNTIYYGHGAYGIEAASHYYFAKEADELTIAEGSMLAAIPKGPSYYSPHTHYDNAKQRQELILNTLKEEQVITKQQWRQAKEAPIQLASQQQNKEQRFAPYFQDVVVQEAAQILDIDTEAVRSGGYHIYTSLNTDTQRELERAIEAEMGISEQMQIGVVSMNPQTGAIVALVGGRAYADSSYNRAVQAKRMPGSTFKPLLYYAALEHGYTPATTLLSKPTDFKLEDGTVYEPSNYNGYYAYDPITLAQAVALSDNIYAVKTNLFLEEETLVKTANHMGIKSDLPAVPSLALGTASVSVMDMVSSYSLFANGGKEIHPHVIKKITNDKGDVIYKQQVENQKQILNEKNAYVMTNLLTGMFDESLNDYMKVTGASIAGQLTKPFAGKSGTTQTDSWMIGYSTEVVTGIWTGYDDNKAIEQVKEHQYAKDIWATYMEKIHENSSFHSFPPPKGVVGVYIDPHSGQRATPYCASKRLSYFVKGTEPEAYCEQHLPSDGEADERNKEDGKRGWLDFFF